MKQRLIAVWSGLQQSVNVDEAIDEQNRSF